MLRKRQTTPTDRLVPEKKTTSKKLKEKTLEAVSSVLPISLLVLVMSLIFVPIDLSTMSLFLFGAALLVVGRGISFCFQTCRVCTPGPSCRA